MVSPRLWLYSSGVPSTLPSVSAEGLSSGLAQDGARTAGSSKNHRTPHTQPQGETTLLCSQWTLAVGPPWRNWLRPHAPSHGHPSTPVESVASRLHRGLITTPWEGAAPVHSALPAHATQEAHVTKPRTGRVERRKSGTDCRGGRDDIP